MYQNSYTETHALREKCPNTELRQNTGKYGPEITLYLDKFKMKVETFH